MKRDGEWYAKIGKIGGINSIPKLKAWHDDCVLKYMKNPKRCERCNVILPYEKRRNVFCSRTCSAITRNVPGRHFRGIPFSNCIKCGKKLSHHGKMCRKCKNKKYNEDVTIAVETGNYSTPKIIRKYLIIVRGHQCEDCKLKEWKNLPIYLETHHIDGNINNNNKTNLKLLCPNCHSTTDNYKSKNKGNGKRDRKRWD